MKVVRLRSILYSLLCSSVTVFATSEKSPAGSGTKADPYVIPQTATAIQVDGRLAETAWQDALTIALPYETWPGENTPAPVRTEALLLYTQSHLYVAFRAYDPDPQKIRANFTERDQIYDDDFIALFLDTFNDERRAFALRSNPLGVQADDIAVTNSDAGVSWDAIYESAGQITDWGFIVEMGIPFNQLRFQRASGEQVWGINLRRLYPRAVYSHIDAIANDRNNDSPISQFLKIRGFAGATPGRNIEVVPTLTGVRTDNRSELPNGKFLTANKEVAAGLSARWGFTANLTLNGTVNPDFSQVEADAMLLDINEPFALEYEEKRPFFTEGADFFSNLKRAVYTRTIREPYWGLKLTGKEDGHTLGLYLVQDRHTNLIFPGSQTSAATSLKMDHTASVLRYKKDFGANYTVGLMATDREGSHYFNRLIGFDNNLRVTKSDRIQLQVLGSNTQYPAQTALDFNQKSGKFNDHFLAFEYDHDTRNWDWWLDYDDVGPDFRADMGFIPRVGYRNVEGGVSHEWIGKPDSWWSDLGLYHEFNYFEDHHGGLLKKSGALMFSYQGRMRSHSHFRGILSEEAFNGKRFDLLNYTSCFGFFPTSNIWFHTHALFGDRIDYENTRLGTRFNIDPELGLNFGKHLRLDLSHTFEWMQVNQARLYTANISQMKLVYHFNVRTFLRGIFQYVNYDYNVANYTFEQAPAYQHFFTQLLFSYKINPFTVFFLGYTDNYLGNQDYALTQSDRTLFLKLSYAWVM
ncbi:carbohydrate binding family 9 domain-containing protein [candidate division KSB1 bacterium]|nr:carbohydrate binding family 9 domain-containing protein [candidate division KSB1 bacterium]